MNKLELQVLLDKAVSSSFLDAIELVMASEKEYLKSDFYKISRVPLIKLYESYVIYNQQKYDWVDRLTVMVDNLDSGIVEDKIQEIIIKLENNPKIVEIITNIFAQFDMKALDVNSEKLGDAISKLKP